MNLDLVILSSAEEFLSIVKYESTNQDYLFFKTVFKTVMELLWIPPAYSGTGMRRSIPICNLKFVI